MLHNPTHLASNSTTSKTNMRKFFILKLILAGLLPISHTDANTTQWMEPSATILQPFTALPDVLLKRNKRYLVFDKGASAVLTVNIGKAIVGTTPRGLSHVMEVSLYYELPYSIEMLLRHKIPTKPKTTTTTTTTTTVAPPIPWLSHEYFPQPHKYYYSPQVAKKWQHWSAKSANSNSWHHKSPPQYTGCRGKWCQQRSSWQQQRRRGRATTAEKTGATAERLFFDLLEQWARIHEFNGRHCVLRTLCESQHLLLPVGESLFHDMLRILIIYATPQLQGDGKNQRWQQLGNAAECANFYGPHCRLSFLQHFTREIHGLTL